MRQYVLYAMAVIFPVSLAVWFVWMLGKSFLQLFDDWQLEKELVELEQQSAAHREQRREINTKRLDNGCEHDFTNIGHGLPRNACSKCGLEADKPQGPCDHVWKSIEGGTPTSVCQLCGKFFSPHAETQTLE